MANNRMTDLVSAVRAIDLVLRQASAYGFTSPEQKVLRAAASELVDAEDRMNEDTAVDNSEYYR